MSMRGMYLGSGDLGVRWGGITVGRARDPSENPNYWQFVDWKKDTNQYQGTTWGNEHTTPIELPFPIKIQGVAHTHVTVSTDLHFFFHDGTFQPNWYKMAEVPGYYGVNTLMPMAGYLQCAWLGYRIAPKCITFRFEGTSIENSSATMPGEENNVDGERGVPSIIVEVSIFGRDPEEDEPEQLINIKATRWGDVEWDPGFDPAFRNFYRYIYPADPEPVLIDWWDKIIMSGRGMNERLVEARAYMATELSPTSVVLSSDLEGNVWTYYGNRSVASECSFLAQATTVATGHKPNAKEARVLVNASTCHSAWPLPVRSTRVWSDWVDSRWYPPDYPRASIYGYRVSSGKLAGIMPSFFYNNKLGNYDGGRFGTICNSGAPEWKPFMRTNRWGEVITYASNGDTAEPFDITHAKYNTPSRNWFTGDTADDLETGYGYVVTTDRLGIDLYNSIYDNETERSFGFALHGTAYENRFDCIAYHQPNVDGRLVLGWPFRRSVGQYHTVMQYRSECDYEVYKPFIQPVAPTPDNLAEDEVAGERWEVGYPSPETICEETGTYIYSHVNRTTAEEMGMSASYAIPHPHGHNTAPVWGIMGRHFLSERQQHTYSVTEGDFCIVYFSEEYATKYEWNPDPNPNDPDQYYYRPDESWQKARHYMMTWLGCREHQSSFYSNNHYRDQNYTCTEKCLYVDEKSIYHSGGYNGPLALQYRSWDTDVYRHLTSGPGCQVEGITDILFFNDFRQCVTRFVEVPAVGEITEISVGWKPDIAWLWPMGMSQGYERCYKTLLLCPQAGSVDPWEGKVVCQTLGSSSFDRVLEYGEWIPDHYGHHSYQLTETGVKIQRNHDYDYPEIAEAEDSDLKFFVCLQRQKPLPNSTVGQFYISGKTNFTYTTSPGYMGEAGLFQMTGQEWLWANPVLAYPPPVLAAGDFQIESAADAGYTYVRWLRLFTEVGVVELDTAAPSYTRLIFCCYPDLVCENGWFDCVGLSSVSGTYVRHMDCYVGDFVGLGQLAGFTYVRWLRMQSQAGAFTLNLGFPVAEAPTATFRWTKAIVAGTGEFISEGFEAELTDLGLFRTLHAEAGRLRYWGGRAVGDRPTMHLETGSFATQGQDARLQQGNSSAGEFVLAETESSGHKLAVPPLEALVGAVDLAGQEANSTFAPEATVYPVRRDIGWHSEYDSTGEEINITGVPFSPAVVASIPKEFPLSIKESRKDDWDAMGGKAGNIYGSAYYPNHFGDWFITKIMGPNWYFSQSEAKPFHGQKSLLKSFNADGITIGDGDWKVPLQVYNSDYDYLEDFPQAFYNWKTANNYDEEIPDEDKNIWLSYTLTFINVDHPALAETQQNTITEDAYRIDGYDYLQRHHWQYSPHPTTNYQYPLLQLQTETNFYKQDPEDPANRVINRDILKKDLEFATGTADELLAVSYAQHLRNLPESWTDIDQYDMEDYMENEESIGACWWLRDQNHGGISMGALLGAQIQFSYRRENQWMTDGAGAFSSKSGSPPSDDDNGEIGWTENGPPPLLLQIVPHGMDRKPDLLIISPSVFSQCPDNSSSNGDFNERDYKRGANQIGTSLWFKPEWGSKGVRATGAELPTDLCAMPPESVQSEMWNWGRQGPYAPEDRQAEGTWDSETDPKWFKNERGDFYGFYGEEHFRMSRHFYGQDPYYAIEFNTPLENYEGQSWEDDYPSAKYALAGKERQASSITWMAINSVPGFTHVGTYSFDGTSSQFVGLGFRPAFLWLKATGGSQCSGLYLHVRPNNPLMDGQSEWTLLEGYPEWINWPEEDRPTSGPEENDEDPATAHPNAWQPRRRDGRSVTFHKGGFYVPVGALGNDPLVPDQEVTVVAFSVEHMKIRLMTQESGQEGAFVIGGQEVGGRKIATIMQASVGAFVTTSGETDLRWTYANQDLLISVAADAGGFALRGMDGNPVLSAPAGTVRLGGEQVGGRKEKTIFRPGQGAFFLRGKESSGLRPVLKCRCGNFRASLQWAGGNDGGCIPKNLPEQYLLKSGSTGGIVEGSIPLESGSDAASGLDAFGWTVHTSFYRDDGYYQIDMPENFSFVVEGTETTTVWPSTNGFFCFESGSSTYSVSHSSPRQNKLLIRGGDRSGQYLASKQFDDGRFVIRQDLGASYTSREAAIRFEVTFFEGAPNFVQINFALTDTSTGTFTAVCNDSTAITEPSGVIAQPHTTYVFVSEDGDGYSWVRHDNAHFAGGDFVPPRSICCYSLPGEFGLEGQDARLVAPATYQRYSGCGSFAIRGGKTVQFARTDS